MNKMHLYITQLLEDLEDVAAHPPVPAYIEPPPQFENYPAEAELALVPFKPISEWTGLSEEIFPHMTQLNADQMDLVNKAIFKVFESMNIELVDVPPDIPPEILYDVLTTNWDIPVQYLPSSGFDLELCTGDPDTCPYGDYCNCEEVEYPEFYSDQHPGKDFDVNEDDLPF
jgi:hypothetical protein